MFRKMIFLYLILLLKKDMKENKIYLKLIENLFFKKVI